MANFTVVRDVVGYLALVVGAVLALFSRLPKQTIQNQADLILALNGRIKILEDQRAEDRAQLFESSRQMGALQGQVETYRSLPLADMAASMKLIADSNAEILNTLQAGK